MLLACRRLRLHATSSASTPAALCARLSDKAKPRSTSESRGEKLAKYNALRNATVDSLMRGPLHVTPETTVFEGVQQMVDRNIGCLLVLDENKALAGIITERDYLRKIAVLGRRSSETTVAEIMTPGQELVIVTPDCQLRECADILNEVRAAAGRGGGGKRRRRVAAVWRVVVFVVGERFSDDPNGRVVLLGCHETPARPQSTRLSPLPYAPSRSPRVPPLDLPACPPAHPVALFTSRFYSSAVCPLFSFSVLLVSTRTRRVSSCA